MSLKILKIIHAALVLGLLVFGLVTYFYGKGFVTQFDVDGDAFIYIIPILAIAGYFGSKLIYKNQLSAIEKKESLASKLAKYQSASITKYALIEGPAIFALLQFMTTGYTLYFSIAACLVLYLVFQKPSKTKLIQELALNSSEQKQLV